MNYQKLFVILIFFVSIGCKDKIIKSKNNENVKPKVTESSLQVELNEPINIDSIKLLFLNSHDYKYLKMLEQIAIKSDASLTTDISVIFKDVYDKNTQQLVSYILKNKSMRIRELLIREWSEDFSVYVGDERKKELQKFKQIQIKNAVDKKLDKDEQKYLSAMLNEVNPSLFD